MDDTRQLDLFARVVPREPVASPVGKRHLVHFASELPNAAATRRLSCAHLDDHLPETWMRRIVALLGDGTPRTFQAIMLQLARSTAIDAAGTHAERGLWLAVERGLLTHTTAAPVIFRVSVPSAASAPQGRAQ